jgi:LPS-assembly protein
MALCVLMNQALAQSKTESINNQPIAEFSTFTVSPSIQLGQTLDPLPDFVSSQHLPAAQSTHIEADYITGSTDDTLTFKGAAHLQRDNLNVQADELAYCPNKSEVSAHGKVIAVQGKDVIRAKTFKLNTDTQVGEAHDTEYFFSQTNARGSADRVTSTLNQQRILTNASYTSCQIGNNDWLLKANQIVLNEATQTGTAKGMSLRFLDVPIFATPYFQFPLGKDRRSGFLSPSTSYSSQSGIDVSVPYYFNLAPHYDATLTTRLMTRRGLQFNTQARYLTPRLQGNIAIDILPDDKLRQQRRWGLFSHHTYQSTAKTTQSGTWRAGLNVERVSDESFFADLSQSTELAATTILPNELWGQYQTNWGTLNARAGQYQTLQDNNQSVVVPYARLPVIDLHLNSISLPKLANLKFDLTAQFARFTHNTATQGIRVYAIPQVSRDWLTDWGFIKAKAKLNMAHYTQLKGLNYQGTGQFSRAIPIVSLDTGLIFERTTPWFKTSKGLEQTVQHTLEPRVYFVYAPFKNQSSAPIFDSALTSFSLEQIFSDNLFVGQDRISNAAHITPAVSTQWINPNTGLTLLKATVGRRYYLTPQRVNLDSSSTMTSNTNNPLMASSDWLLAATGQLVDSVYIDTAMQYDQDQREIINSSYTVRYTPAAHQVFGISKRFTKDTKHAIDISAQWRFAGNHAFLGKLGYSLGIPSEKLEKKVTESLLGYEYDAGCWLFRIAAKRYINTANVKATSFSFQLEFSGLTQSKSNAVNLFTNSIPGYTPFQANNTWTYDAFRAFE